MNDAVVTLVNMIVNLNDQLRVAIAEIDRLRAETARLQAALDAVQSSKEA